MNRPKREDYKINDWEYSGQYVLDLEKYCDELEQENKKLKKSIDNVAGFLYVHGVRFDQDEETD